MKKLNLGDLEISKFCLGGAQLGKKTLFDGVKFVDEAKSLGINIVDCHHRYDNCESIVGMCFDIVKMTKISAYKLNEMDSLFDNSKKLLGDIDILWISDLDDLHLYSDGEQIYNKYKNKVKYIGITTENAVLAYKFLKEHPECKLFMVPLYPERTDLAAFAKYAKSNGKIVFAIKTFCGGQILHDCFDIEDCVNFVKSVNPDVVVLGTGNKNHLKELIELYNE